MSFTPVIKPSHSIPRSLLEFSKERDIDVKRLDFELINHSTLLKKESDTEYKYLSDTKEITLADKKNPTTIILQEYSITIKPLLEKEEEIKLSLATNKLKTKAVISIKEGSIFRKTPTLAKELKDKIWHKKLGASLLIDVFEDSLDAQLAKLIKVVPEGVPLKKDLKFNVALGIEPTPPIDAKHEKLYEAFSKESKSIIDGVDKGVFILRYIKPVSGVDGRSCTGKYIAMPEPKTFATKPEIDATILSKEMQDSIEYFSNDTGYVVFTGKKLSISKNLKLDGANFKTSANIETSESNQDVKVHIGHTKSYSEDAIGSGVNIDVKELNVDGSVASGVNISTQELNIEAQTHKNSKMAVQNTANIKLHRGDLRANEANIDVLESGKVTAQKSIYVKQMLGGMAIAPVIKVDELLSNATLIASELIEIKTIAGSHNRLIIDPNSIESYHQDIENLKEKISQATKSFELQTKTLNEKIIAHAKRAGRIKTFKQRILIAQKSGLPPVKQDLLRIKQYKKESDALKVSQSDLQEEELQIQSLTQELEKMQNLDLHAKITSQTMYDGTTKIIFKDTKEEIRYIPEGDAKSISLRLNENSQKVISVL